MSACIDIHKSASNYRFNLTRSQPPQTWSTPHEYGISLIFFSSVKIEDLEHLKYRFSVGTCKHVRKSYQQEYTCQRLRPIPAHILVITYMSVYGCIFLHVHIIVSSCTLFRECLSSDIWRVTFPPWINSFTLNGVEQI